MLRINGDSNYKGILGRGGARGGLEGDIAPRRNMLAPLSEGETLFFQRFLAVKVPPKTVF